MAKEDVTGALDCIEPSFLEERPRVRPGTQERFRRYVANLVDDETSFDAHQDKMTKPSMMAAIQELLFDVAEELDATPGRDSLDIFDRLKPQTLRETLGADPTMYTVAFPLNLRRIHNLPTSFTTSETTIKRIKRERWKRDYESPAREDDSFTRFLDRESPNTLEPDRFGNETFTFWTATYPARDGYYALFAVQNIVRLFVAKLNYVFHERQRERPQPASSERPAHARWSPLQEPFFYLIFNGSTFADYRQMDYEYRRRSLFPSEEVEVYLERFQRLPDIAGNIIHHDKSNDAHADLDETLVNALFAYQDGISTATPQQSFFSFWRGIENLTYVGQNHPVRYVMERARPLFEDEAADEYIPWYQKEALTELYNKRNKIAHTGPHIYITESHRTVAKRMLDKLLELHFDRYADYDTIDFETFLIHNAKSLYCNKQLLQTNRRTNLVIRDVLFKKARRKDDPLLLKSR